MQVAIEVSHAMQSFSCKNIVLDTIMDVSNVHLYQPDLSGGVEKV